MSNTENDPTVAYVSGETSAFVRLKKKNGRVRLLPYGSLISGQLTPNTSTDNHDLLALKFASHEVTVTGFRLAEVLNLIQTCKCHLIQETNSAQAGFGKKDAPPSVLKIEIKPED